MGSPWSLEGRRALVTGGGSGIGHACARRLAEAGSEVVIVGRRADELALAATAIGDRARPFPADVRDPESLDALVDEIDIYVHAAGTQVKRSAHDHEPDDWDDTFAVHLRAFAALSRLVVARAADRPAPDGGVAIVAIGSMATRLGFADVSAYAAAKGAVTALVRTLAVEWAPLGVRVNTVTPGWIATPMTDRAFAANPAHRERIVARTPLRRIGDPDDVALAVGYLVSPAARFVTGAEIVVDGGVSIAL